MSNHKMNYSWIYLFMSVFILSMPVFPQDIGAETVIPFTLSERSHLILVDTYIENSEKMFFIFDTGASMSVLDKDAFDRLEEQGIMFEKVKSQPMRTPDGKSTTEIPVVLLKNLRFGQIELKNIEALVLPLPKMPELKISGVFSFKNIHKPVIAIDYPNSKLIISDKGIKTSKGIHYDQSRIIEFDMLINGKKYRTHLDTGSPAFISIPYSLKDQFDLIQEPKLLGKGMMGMNKITIYSAQIKGEVRIGDMVINDPLVNFTDGGYGALNIGYRFLKDKKVVLNKDKNIFIIQEQK